MRATCCMCTYSKQQPLSKYKAANATERNPNLLFVIMLNHPRRTITENFTKTKISTHTIYRSEYYGDALLSLSLLTNT
jgi:hypothetical protein